MSWPRVPLAEIATIERNTVVASKIVRGSLYVGLEHIDSGGTFVSVKTVDAGDLASNKFYFGTKHILFGRLRPYLKKTARPNFEGICSTDILPILPSSRVDRDYLFHYLRHPKVVEKAVARCTGANLPRISPRALMSFEVPLPPLTEQRRIADILDRADAIRRKRKTAIALTEELLRSTFLEMFGDPVTNPMGWPVKPLGELVEIRGGGTPSRARPEFFAGCIPWVTAKDFKSDFMSDSQEHISEEAITSSAAKFVPLGTILIVVKSKILARRLPVAISTVPLCFNQDVKGLVAHDLHKSPYIAAHIRIGEQKILQQARGVNTEGLTLGHLRSLPVMQPPADKVDQFLELEAQIRHTVKLSMNVAHESEDLFNALVTQTFSGEFSV